LQTKSKEFKNNEKAGQVIQYGRGTVMGNPSVDRACFSPDETHCVHNMSFLTVIKAKELEALKGSGLIGLSPTPGDKANMDDPMHKGVPGFVSQLKASSEFEKDFDPVFSLYLSNEESVKGKIVFGGYDLAQFAKQGAKDSDIFWADQASNEQYWMINSKEVKFGDDKVIASNY